MEEAAGVTATPSKSLQELAMEGQSALEAFVEAAHHTLASMNEVLCNAALWTTSSSSSSSSSSAAAAATVAGHAPSASGVAPQQSAAPTGGAAGDLSDLVSSKVNAEGSSQEAGWGALDESRLQLRLSAASLKAVIATIFSCPQIRDQEDPSSSLADMSDPVEVEKLEERRIFLTEEVDSKNKVMKLLIDQLRELISDISMWQNPRL